MRRRFRMVGRTLIVLVGALAAAVFVLLPPRAATAPAAPWASSAAVVKGAFHIHSERSDGTGTLDEIAAAAARAGLKFIVLTDHGDGTRAPDPPAYRAGVLCIDAVEVSTSHGHVVAVGVPQMPFRLAGHPRDVIEDVHRAGGFAIAAHPGSLKPELRWNQWDMAIDGLEWLNADSEWRDEFWTSLGRVLITYPFRSAETLATLLDRPVDVLAQWDRGTRHRRLVGVAGADAHARLSIRSQTDPYEDRVLARLPSYDASFMTFSNHVIVDSPLTGDADRDADAVLLALGRGRVVTSIDGLVQLGAFEFSADAGSHSARPGDYLDAPEGGELRARIAAPIGTTLVLLRDGTEIKREAGDSLRVPVGPEPAAYRLEVRLARAGREANVPWVVANPIYVNLRAQHAQVVTPALSTATHREAVLGEWWRTESSTGSESRLASGASGPEAVAPVEWRFQIAGGPARSQYAAIAFGSAPQFAPFDRIIVRARASRPLRLWGQLRAPGENGGRRWARSFYVDSEERTIELPFAEFLPVGADNRQPLPARDQLDSFLLVADTLHTLPGTSATFSIASVALAR